MPTGAPNARRRVLAVRKALKVRRPPVEVVMTLSGICARASSTQVSLLRRGRVPRRDSRGCAHGSSRLSNTQFSDQAVCILQRVKRKIADINKLNRDGGSFPSSRCAGTRAGNDTQQAAGAGHLIPTAGAVATASGEEIGREAAPSLDHVNGNCRRVRQPKRRGG